MADPASIATDASSDVHSNVTAWPTAQYLANGLDRVATSVALVAEAHLPHLQHTVLYCVFLVWMFLFFSPFRFKRKEHDWYVTASKAVQSWCGLHVVLFHVVAPYLRRMATAAAEHAANFSTRNGTNVSDTKIAQCFRHLQQAIENTNAAAGSAIDGQATANAAVGGDSQPLNGGAQVAEFFFNDPNCMMSSPETVAQVAATASVRTAMFFPLFAAISATLLLAHRLKRSLGLRISYAPTASALLLNSVLIALVLTVHFAWCSMLFDEALFGGTVHAMMCPYSYFDTNQWTTPARQTAEKSSYSSSYSSHSNTGTLLLYAQLTLGGLGLLIGDYLLKKRRGFEPYGGLLWCARVDEKPHGFPKQHPAPSSPTVDPTHRSSRKQHHQTAATLDNNTETSSATSEPSQQHAKRQDGRAPSEGQREFVGADITAFEVSGACSTPADQQQPNGLGMVGWYSLMVVHTAVKTFIGGNMTFGQFDYRAMESNHGPKVFRFTDNAGDNGPVTVPPGSEIARTERDEREAAAKRDAKAKKKSADPKHSKSSTKEHDRKSGSGKNTAADRSLSDQFGGGEDEHHRTMRPFTEEDEGEDFWFDWVADVGDGFNSTYEIARQLAQPELDVSVPARLPRSGASSSGRGFLSSVRGHGRRERLRYFGGQLKRAANKTVVQPMKQGLADVARRSRKTMSFGRRVMLRQKGERASSLPATLRETKPSRTRPPSASGVTFVQNTKAAKVDTSSNSAKGSKAASPEPQRPVGMTKAQAAALEQQRRDIPPTPKSAKKGQSKKKGGTGPNAEKTTRSQQPTKKKGKKQGSQQHQFAFPAQPASPSHGNASTGDGSSHSRGSPRYTASTVEPFDSSCQDVSYEPSAEHSADGSATQEYNHADGHSSDRPMMRPNRSFDDAAIHAAPSPNRMRVMASAGGGGGNSIGEKAAAVAGGRLCFEDDIEAEARSKHARRIGRRGHNTHHHDDDDEDSLSAEEEEEDESEDGHGGDSKIYTTGDSLAPAPIGAARRSSLCLLSDTSGADLDSMDDVCAYPMTIPQGKHHHTTDDDARAAKDSSQSRSSKPGAASSPASKKTPEKMTPGASNTATTTTSSQQQDDQVVVAGTKLRTYPRGRFLLLGGDLAYPMGTVTEYRDRFFSVYDAALPYRGAPRLPVKRSETNSDQVMLFPRKEKSTSYVKARKSTHADTVTSTMGKHATGTMMVTKKTKKKQGHDEHHQDQHRQERGTAQHNARQSQDEKRKKAMKKRKTTHNAPVLFAIPGNHDWCDGLEAYRGTLLTFDHLGGWSMPQTTSYFALHLPHDWWFFCMDTGIAVDIDQLQMQYFLRLTTEELGPQSSVVVVVHEPVWINDAYDRPGLSHTMPRITTVVRALGEKCRMRLCGDVHNYSRYEAARPNGPSSSQGKGQRGDGSSPSGSFASGSASSPATSPSRAAPKSSGSAFPSFRGFSSTADAAKGQKDKSAKPQAPRVPDHHSPVLVVSGGGGAFLHGTAVPGPNLSLYGQTYDRKCTYPAPTRRFSLSWILRFRLVNWKFDLVGALLYFSLVASLLPVDVQRASNEVLGHGLVPLFPFTNDTATAAPSNVATASVVRGPHTTVGSHCELVDDDAVLDGDQPVPSSPAKKGSSASSSSSSLQDDEQGSVRVIMRGSSKHIVCKTTAADNENQSASADVDLKALTYRALGSSGISFVRDVIATALWCSYRLLTEAVLSLVMCVVVFGITMGVAGTIRSPVLKLTVAVIHAFAHVGSAILLLATLAVAVERAKVFDLVESRHDRWASAMSESIIDSYAALVDVCGWPCILLSDYFTFVFPSFASIFRPITGSFDFAESAVYLHEQALAEVRGGAAAGRLTWVLYYIHVFIFYWVLAAPVVSMVLGTYLCASVSFLQCAWHEAYSAFQIERFKHFLRIRLRASDGALEVHVIATDDMPERWQRDRGHDLEAAAMAMDAKSSPVGSPSRRSSSSRHASSSTSTDGTSNSDSDFDESSDVWDSASSSDNEDHDHERDSRGGRGHKQPEGSHGYSSSASDQETKTAHKKKAGHHGSPSPQRRQRGSRKANEHRDEEPRSKKPRRVKGKPANYHVVDEHEGSHTMRRPSVWAAAGRAAKAPGCQPRLIETFVIHRTPHS